MRGFRSSLVLESELARSASYNFGFDGPSLNAHFHMPQLEEISALARQAEALSSIGRSLMPESLETRLPYLERAFASIQQPWASDTDFTASLGGMATMVDIGYAVRTFDPFESRLPEIIRPALGDWRNEVPFDNELPTEEVRARAYEDHGFDKAIISIPNGAFAVLADGLSDEFLEEEFGEADEYLFGYKLAESLYPFYQKIERALRIMIVDLLESEYGKGWVRQCVSGDTRKRWEDRREAERKRGLPAQDLIFYADFTDYQAIILRKDLWEAKFQAVFKRRESVAEAFHRASPARNCISHGRPLLKQEAIYARVEILRIWTAIGPYVKKRSKN